jgi:hypothetical protein
MTPTFTRSTERTPFSRQPPHIFCRESREIVRKSSRLRGEKGSLAVALFSCSFLFFLTCGLARPLCLPENTPVVFTQGQKSTTRFTFYPQLVSTQSGRVGAWRKGSGLAQPTPSPRTTRAREQGRLVC